MGTSMSAPRVSSVVPLMEAFYLSIVTSVVRAFLPSGEWLTAHGDYTHRSRSEADIIVRFQ